VSRLGDVSEQVAVRIEPWGEGDLPGSFMRCNDWRLDLQADQAGGPV
jgi:hypothetical protein